jgi:hypothetical protein
MDHHESCLLLTRYENIMFIQSEMMDIIPGVKFALFRAPLTTTTITSISLTTINMKMMMIKDYFIFLGYYSSHFMVDDATKVIDYRQHHFFLQ